MKLTFNPKMHQSFIEDEELKLLQLHRESHSTPVGKKCTICISKSIKSYSKSYFTCGHNDICLECLHQYIDHSLQQNNIPICANFKCSGSFMYKKLQEMTMLTAGLKGKIKQYFKEKRLKCNKKCTQPDCFGFINHGTCDLCLTNFCQNCWAPEHRGQCQNPQILLPSEIIKRCPNCKQGIEREGGCLHVECLLCKHSFCFKCLQKWSSKHHATCGTGDSSLLDWIVEAFKGKK